MTCADKGPTQRHPHSVAISCRLVHCRHTSDIAMMDLFLVRFITKQKVRGYKTIVMWSWRPWGVEIALLLPVEAQTARGNGDVPCGHVYTGERLRCVRSEGLGHHGDMNVARNATCADDVDVRVFECSGTCEAKGEVVRGLGSRHCTAGYFRSI